MDEYTIYCTAEQTKKALELGAPIERMTEYYRRKCIYLNGWSHKVPTAEQMFGWLEEQGIRFCIHKQIVSWIYYVGRKDMDDVKWEEGLDSRQEASITAIDAALEYLENLKQ